jgi:phosphoglycerate dehydrogenase-like enzyme
MAAESTASAGGPLAPNARVAVQPEGSRPWLADAVRAGGGQVVAPSEAEALVWTDTDDADALDALLTAQPNLRWVQLPWAGIEPYVATTRAHADRVWTCGKGVYAEPVAEHALTLGLAGLRGTVAYGRATSWRGPGELGTTLRGAHVVVLGGGAIAEAFLRLVAPFGARTTVVRRRSEPVAGADRTVTTDRLHEVLTNADLVVLALALTPATTGILAATELALLPPHAWVVNVARGAHIVTDDLLAALNTRSIGGAALDVTDPEPLPDGHPLWSAPNCLITPHIANTSAMAVPLLSERVAANVARWAVGDGLLGVVDPDAGY